MARRLLLNKLTFKSLKPKYKRCRKCKVRKKHTLHNFRKGRRVCKRCCYSVRDWEKEREISRRYHLRHRERLNTKARNQSRTVTLWLNTLKNKPCMDCGIEYPPYVMDWDHVRGKKYKPVSALGRTLHFTQYLKITVLTEIAKCDLVCSNCHRIRTHTRRMKISKIKTVDTEGMVVLNA